MIRALLLLLVMSGSVAAQDLRAVARIDPAASSITDANRGLSMTLSLSQAVPWRIFVRDDPARVVLDFREVAWDGVNRGALDQADGVTRLRVGNFRPGWSRMVLELDRPLVVDSAEMRTDAQTGRATISVRLDRASEQAFADAIEPSAELSDLWALPEANLVPKTRPRQTGDRDLVVVLDPGHGGIDPGAERQGVREAHIMLSFALELEEALIRRGGYQVVLTRRADVFVPLATRVSIARAAGADLFISLHADAIAEGQASGATVYTLSEKATDAVSAKLAERKNRDDLVLGADLRDQDDQVAAILMDLARAEVTPRSLAFAEALVAGIGNVGGRLHKRPRLAADFAVLRAPDIPSVLLEVGFMSDDTDLENLQRPEWRASVASGVVDAIDAWAVEDAAQALRVRR